jgi:hypothetical protein
MEKYTNDLKIFTSFYRCDRACDLASPRKILSSNSLAASYVEKFKQGN